MYIPLQFFTFLWPCIVTNFFLIKPTRRTNFPNFILSKTLHVPGISFVRHQEFSVLHSTLLYFLQFWWQLPSIVRMDLTLLGSCHHTCKKYTNVEYIVENSWWWAKEMPETCRVFWQNKIWEIRASCWFFKKKILFTYSEFPVGITSHDSPANHL